MRLSCIAPDMASAVRLLDNAVVHFQGALAATAQPVTLFTCSRLNFSESQLLTC